MVPHPLKDKEAPSFTLPDQNGEEVSIKPGTTGTPLVVFFYPTAGSYGCTKEACGFRDAIQEVEVFKRTNVTVVGISSDTVDRQKKFVDQNGLPYPVLSDSKGEARKAYQVKRGLLGLTEGRETFVIDSKGIVRDVLSTVVGYDEHHKFVGKALTLLEEEGKVQTQTALASEAPTD